MRLPWSGLPGESSESHLESPGRQVHRATFPFYEKVLKDETAAPKQRAGWLAAEAAALMAAGDARRAESRAREALTLEPRQETAKRLLAELGDR